MLKSVLLSLGFTLLLELCFAALLGVRRKKDFLLVFLVNVVTNPPLVLSLNLLSQYRPELVCFFLILPLEFLVVCIEWLLYRRRLDYKRIPPFLLSLLLNVISYSGGLLLS